VRCERARILSPVSSMWVYISRSLGQEVSKTAIQFAIETPCQYRHGWGRNKGKILKKRLSFG
jgi:hypothetical protein